MTEEDAFFERKLHPLNTDAAPENHQRMAAAIEQGRQSFLSLSGTNSDHRSSERNAQPSPALTPNRKTGLMFAFAKPIAVLTTSVTMLVIAWFSASGPAAADVTLGKVLDQALNAKTLHILAVSNGQESDVWISGNAVRWQESPQQYRIANGTRLWKINEAASEVSESPNQWLADGKNIDLIAMLGGPSTKSVRNAKPIDQAEHSGVLCNVFQIESDNKSGLVIRAFASARTNELYSIGAWPQGVATGNMPPLTEFTLVARNIDIDESKFVVRDTLSEDGRIGRIRDAQGIVQLRPKTSRRWTSVVGPMLVQPGDWIRTDVRGANAAAIELLSGYKLIVGPGTVLELDKPKHIVLHRGEVQITGSETTKSALRVHGPDDQNLRVVAGETQHVRLDRNERLVTVMTKPVWLAGFEGTSSNESIGALIANIDGRDVPLTVGYHKVKVEIRDQIARTTIEESFVNRTDGRLEGVFHFPLPQDASISGFGMWIGGELIEADVVEKQRAREIYETILREKRDPGLLEWEGGNIFKARVFPIEAYSEKRIRIVYTQVLPMRANRYRYAYGLRSELLQTTPLRELSLEVLVHSALKLKSVTSATHTVRSQLTEHSASLEFSAQEYTPARDFEVVCEVDSRESDVVVVPHRRGDGGYFLAQVTPPSAAGNWQREVLPDETPLQLLLVCDTSASMNSRNRKLQEQFVSSVLGSLGDRDRFNIAVCDVDCHWQHDKLMPAEERPINAAVEWLESRRSLGWTDLDHMVESVIDRLTHGGAAKPSPSQTHVIYIGDGIVTARDADPLAFVNRIARTTKNLSGGTFHAVSVGSSFESGVLKSIAAVGGGSVRQIDGEQTPVRVAHELLNEITRPGLRDLSVEFEGIQVAAVYPGELSNLAAGTQQMIIGRYLPTGEDQTGEIIITGTRNGEPVKYSSRITMQDAEHGNSFIPRLWARSHLEHLLQQGRNEFIKDDIIALSEEFHIMTPYTSLLVLETDADRERFGVKRRFLMRDGEKFFAEGRSQASFELVQQQMKAAGNWRLGMRRQVLSALAGLGRDVEALPQPVVENRWGGVFSGPEALNGAFERDEEFAFGGFGYGGMMGGSGGGGGVGGGGGFFGGENKSLPSEADFGGEYLEIGGTLDHERSARGEFESDDDRETDRQLMSGDEDFREEAFADFDSLGTALSMARGGRQAAKKNRKLEASPARALSQLFSLQKSKADKQMRRYSKSAEYSYGFMNAVSPPDASWLLGLFPELPTAPATPTAKASAWPNEAKQIALRLQQPLQLDNDAGLRIEMTTNHFDVDWNRLTNRHQTTQYYHTQQWLTFDGAAGSQLIANWCTDEVRGVYSATFELGRTRTVEPTDMVSLVPGNRPYATTSLEQTFWNYDTEVQRDGDDAVVLILTDPTAEPARRFHITIDTRRNVILKTEWQRDGNTTSSTEYSEFLAIAGCSWPGTIRTRDGEGRITSSIRQTATLLAAAEFQRVFETELPDPEFAQLLTMPLPSVRKARVNVSGGGGDFEDNLVLLLDAAQIQNWEAAMKFLEQLESVVDGRSAQKWIRLAYLLKARENEEARELAMAILKSTANVLSQGDLFRAVHVLSHLNSVVDRNEMLALLDAAKPVFDRQPEQVDGPRQWKQRRAAALSALGRVDEALLLYRDIATTGPWDFQAQATYASQLATTGEFQAGRTWLRKQFDRDTKFNDYELQYLRNSYAEILRQEYLVDELVTFLEEWVATNPQGSTAFAQYLAALVSANRSDDADQLALKWMTESRQPEKLSGEQLARLNAAISYAVGQPYGSYQDWIDPQWHEPLGDTAVFFLTHDHHLNIASRIVGHYRFAETEDAVRVRRESANVLRDSVGEMNASRLSSFLNWTLGYDDLSDADWANIAKALRKRWDESENGAAREQPGVALVRIYAHTSPDTLHLPFMRKRIQRARDEQQPLLTDQLVSELFEELLNQEWTDEVEAECFQWLLQLEAGQSSKNARPVNQLLVQIAALHRLVDAMLAARMAVDETDLQTNGHPETLTRTELTDKRRAFATAARNGLIQRLNDVAVEPQTNAELADWFRIERLHLQVLLADTPIHGDDKEARLAESTELRNRVLEECWSILGAAPILIPEVEDADIEKAAQQHLLMLRRVLQQRAFVMVSNLSLRRTAPQDAAQKVLDYIDAGIDHGRPDAVTWKSRKASLLIALDQPQALEKNLRQWIRDDNDPAPFQLLLARLLAEQGHIDDAVALFETVERREPLAPADYSALANWYMALDRKDDYRRAKIQVFKASDDWRLNQYISQQRQPWYRNDASVPSELNENVLFAFQALFEKSTNPGSYVYQLRDFYTACRDFRLLRMVPDSLVGRTQQQIYAFLTQLQNNLLEEVRHEATADQMRERLLEVRNTAKTNVDERALDLFEAMLERRAAMVLNQPGTHIDAAVAALKRAFNRDWADGEVVQMATFLTSMGTIERPVLAVERLRQLRALFAMTKPGTDDRFNVAWQLASALFHSHNEKDDAVSIMENALQELRTANRGGLPAHLNTPFNGYLGLLENMNRYAEAEAHLQVELEHPVNPTQKFWLLNRLNELCHSAFEANVRVSLGSGEDLYRNLLQRLLTEAESRNDDYHYRTLHVILDLFRTAETRKISTFEKDLRQYAFRQFPELLNDKAANYRDLVESTADTVHELLSPRDGLEFLLDRLEHYPARFEHTWENAWQQLGWRLADWRHEAKQDLSELEPRLLKLTLTELRRDLETQQTRNRAIYEINSGHFWKAKAADFANVADKVVADHGDSGAVMLHVAQYLYHGLHLYNRAIEVLLNAHDKGVLDVNQQIVLVDLLHEQNRHAESISVLRPIVQKYPDEMSYRTRLMTAYAKSNRPQRLQRLLAATEEHFRQPGRWHESSVAQLAHCCMENNLLEPAVKFYGEVIPLHQRSRPNRGIGNGTLSEYYSSLARAYSGLGKTIEAVDAAAAGVVSWGPRHDQRSGALSWLQNVISNAKDLDDYVVHLDKQAESNGTDSPIIRRKAGMVYADRGEYQKAVTQLRIAADLQPTDSETHQALIRCFDQLRDTDAVVQQMLLQLDFDRHNLELYRQLADRLSDDEQQSERAATTLVESAPLEASHHQALAELRQHQNRWDDAIQHWQHVADLRSLEPSGLLKLSEAQLHEKRWTDAATTLKKLSQTEWPARFSNVSNDIQKLQQLLPQE